MNCPNCNAILLDDASFCGSCGTTIQPAVILQQSSPVTRSQPAGGSFHFDADGRGQGRGYTWAIEHQGAFALAVVNLQPSSRSRPRPERWSRCRQISICIPK